MIVSTTNNVQPSYAPIAIQSTMHTLSRTPRDDQWYMDTGTTSHMSVNGGNLISYSNTNNNINVVSGQNISNIGCGNALVPNPHCHHSLNLNNVLHAPN